MPVYRCLWGCLDKGMADLSPPTHHTLAVVRSRSSAIDSDFFDSHPSNVIYAFLRVGRRKNASSASEMQLKMAAATKAM